MNWIYFIFVEIIRARWPLSGKAECSRVIVGGRVRLEEVSVRRHTGKNERKKIMGPEHSVYLTQHMEITLCNHASQVTAQWKEMAREWESRKMLSYFHLRCEGQEEEYRGKDLRGRLMSQIMGYSCAFCSLFHLWFIVCGLQEVEHGWLVTP